LALRVPVGTLVDPGILCSCQPLIEYDDDHDLAKALERRLTSHRVVLRVLESGV